MRSFVAEPEDLSGGREIECHDSRQRQCDDRVWALVRPCHEATWSDNIAIPFRNMLVPTSRGCGIAMLQRDATCSRCKTAAAGAVPSQGTDASMSTSGSGPLPIPKRPVLFAPLRLADHSPLSLAFNRPADLGSFPRTARRPFFTLRGVEQRRVAALFEFTDAVLCADGPVTSLVELTLTAEHRHGHGTMYDAVNHGWLEPRRLRRLLASTPLPRAADGRIVLAVDVSTWLRPDAPTSPELLFCHVYGRGRSADQFIPGWPYSSTPRWRRGARPGRPCWTRSGWGPATTPPR